MSKFSPILTNFTAGEFSPQLEGRVDIARYNNAAQIIENFLIAPYGGIQRRPGFQFVAPAKFPDKLCRLIPFQFSTLQAYILEFGEGYIRFFRDEGAITETDKVISGATQANPVNLTITAHGYSVGDEIIINSVIGMTELNGKRFRVDTVAGANNITIEDLDGVTIDGTAFTAYVSSGVSAKIVEIATTYLESELLDIQYAQSADILTVVHNKHIPRNLSRLSDVSWTLTDETFIGGPFQPVNADIAITVTASTTAIGAVTLTASTAIFNVNHVGGLFRLGGRVGVAPDDVQGYVNITGFTSSTVVTGQIIATLSGLGPHDDWAFGSFSVDAGFPSSVAYHEQRRFYGGTTKEPQTVFGSQILIFNDFTTGAIDTDSLNYQIATEEVNAIRWMSSGRGLGIGTSGAAFILSSGTNFTPLTPTNVQVRRETTFGSELIVPRRIGNFNYYVQRGGRKIREFAYNFDIDSHRALDMTLLSEHITESMISIVEYQQNPNSVFWAIRKDGEAATMTRQIDQEVIGWTRQVTGATIGGAGVYETIAVIPNGEEDQVWTSTKRIVNGTTRRFVEFMKPLDFGNDQADAFYVDSGLTYTGPEIGTLVGLDHLEGETVQILNKGAVSPPQVVTNGLVTLADSATTTKAHVGLGYNSEIETLRIEGGSARGTGQGKVSRIFEATIRFFETLGGLYGDRDDQDRFRFRTPPVPMGQPPPLFTGDVRENFPTGYSRGARIFIKQDQPLPMTILALIPDMEVFNR